MNLPKLIHQKSYEHVVYLLRRHPITFVPRVIIFFILLSVPSFISFLFHRLQPAFFQNQPAFAAAVIAATIYYLSIFLLFYTEFLDYYLDLWIVTNDRIVDIVQQGVIARMTTELDLFQIQDVTTEIKGFFPTVFQYGDVYIKTASINPNIIFYQVSHPNTVRETLLQLSHEDRKYHFIQPGDFMSTPNSAQ